MVQYNKQNLLLNQRKTKLNTKEIAINKVIFFIFLKKYKRVFI